MINNEKTAVRPKNKKEAEELLKKFEKNGHIISQTSKESLELFGDKIFSDDNNKSNICYNVEHHIVYAGTKHSYIDRGFHIIPYR